MVLRILRMSILSKQYSTLDLQLNYLDYSMAVYQQSHDANVVPHNPKTLLSYPPASCLASHVREPVKVQVQRQSQKHS